MSSEIIEVKPTIYMPNVADGLNAWNAYQKLVEKLLDESDYAKIGRGRHRKRSGWSKLRRAFNITAEIREGYWETLDDGEFGYYVTVRAQFPDGRYEDGDGYCDSGEMKGSRGPAATRHNVRSKAITRAKNRATADLIGTGEVSAEEFIDTGDDDFTSVSDVAKRARQKAKKNGNGLTLADAKAMTTPKGTPYGDLDADQLLVIIEKYPDSLQAKSAKMVLDTIPMEDEPADENNGDAAPELTEAEEQFKLKMEGSDD